MMSLVKDKLLRPNSRENSNPQFKSTNQSFQSYKIIHSFAINYVLTIKGAYNDKDNARSLVAEKRKSYEKVFHPIFLTLVIKHLNNHAELMLRRTNSSNNQFINIKNVIEDHKYPQYFYLEAVDEHDSNRSRTHIFNVINQANLQQIRIDYPLFGSLDEMKSHLYSVPSNMNDVLCSIQTNCLPHLGHHVAVMKEKMSTPLKNIFAKKIKSSNSIKSKKSIKEIKGYKSYNHQICRPSSPELIERMNHKPSIGSFDFKSRSIENLLLLNADFETLINCSSMGKHNSNVELQKSTSSLNEKKKIRNYKSEENLYFYQFDNVLQDEIGLKHFKNFLAAEFSSENINFWEAVNFFSTITDEKIMKIEAKKIFYEYLDENTNTPVNLECDVVEKARQKLNAPTKDMFQVAQTHIYHLMKNDSYSRFTVSPHFRLWQTYRLSNSEMKSATSTSSLNESKKHKSMFSNFMRSKNRLSKEGSRKSSIHTIDSDISISGTNPNTFMIRLAYDNDNCNKVINIQQNKRLNFIMRRLDKKFNEIDLIAWDQYDNKIISFNDYLTNLNGRRIVVEKAALLRIGFVQNYLDSALYENIWFVVKCKNTICLSSAIDPVVKRLKIHIDRICIIQEENSKISLDWEIPVSKLHNSTLLLLELDLFYKAKIFGKSLLDTLEVLWKKILNDNTFHLSLPFDSDNILDSRDDFFIKYKLDRRRVGYIKSSNNIDILINRNAGYSFDDQRGMCTEQQLEMPDFLKVPTPRTSSRDSSDSKRFSALNLGDSDFSFSEIDESSDPSPDRYELISDFE